MIKIAPSILSADFSKLGEEVKKVSDAGADYIHIDVMDGHFVPNITIGPLVVKSIRGVTNLIFDVHLMIESPDKYIDEFINAGADIITVHQETCYHLNRTIQKIKDRGKKAAVALNPATPIYTIEEVLKDIDMVLLMSVNPGFAGQNYIHSITQKIIKLKETLKKDELDYVDIEVDGGVTLENVSQIINAGANVIVSGSTIFGANDVYKVIQDLRQENGGSYHKEI